jgi:hypothetical protein
MAVLAEKANDNFEAEGPASTGTQRYLVDDFRCSVAYSLRSRLRNKFDTEP